MAKFRIFISSVQSEFAPNDADFAITFGRTLCLGDFLSHFCLRICRLKIRMLAKHICRKLPAVMSMSDFLARDTALRMKMVYRQPNVSLMPQRSTTAIAWSSSSKWQNDIPKSKI